MRLIPPASVAPLVDNPEFKRIFCDFTGSLGSAGDGALQAAGTGTGSASTAITATASRPGVKQQQTGTTNTGSVLVGSLLNQLFVGVGNINFAAAMRIPTLSDAVQRFQVYAGLFDQSTIAPANGIFWTYLDTLNGGRWTLQTVVGGATLSLDSGITVVANSWYTLGLRMSATGLLYATIDDVPYTPLPTGFPTAAPLGFGASIRKSVGTTSRNMDLDYLFCEYSIPGRM